MDNLKEFILNEEKINKSKLIVKDLENLILKMKKDFNISEDELF
jgi:hypothetical protein